MKVFLGEKIDFEGAFYVLNLSDFDLLCFEAQAKKCKVIIMFLAGSLRDVHFGDMSILERRIGIDFG